MGMLRQLKFLVRYIRYYLTGQTKHDIHSPFVFELLTNVIEDLHPYYIFKPIEVLRAQLLNSEKKITITDFGAGSTINTSHQRAVGDIAKNSAKSPKYGQLLFRLVNHFSSKNIIELGTSLGISSLYLSTHDSHSHLVTLEGCPETAAVARRNFEILKRNNIDIVIGDFQKTLPSVLEKMRKPDFIFFDGNHRKGPTLQYFQECLAYAHNESVFVFDDIHWSDEMEAAWTIIKDDPRVTLTIDLFFIGLVFFRKEQQKQHFTVRF